MNEAEYLMKNYGDRGEEGVTASTDNTLRDLHNLFFIRYESRIQELFYYSFKLIL